MLTRPLIFAAILLQSCTCRPHYRHDPDLPHPYYRVDVCELPFDVTWTSPVRCTSNNRLPNGDCQ